jgi:asparagine synthase (glutamine-hydrolysing)
MDEFDSIVEYMDEPFADSSVFLNYQLSKLTKEHVSVVLSGVGGDELFGGYNRHQAFLIQKKLQHIKFLKFFSKIDMLGTKRTSKYGNMLRHFSKLLDSLGENANETYLKTISYHFLKMYDLGIEQYNLDHILLYDIKYYMCDNLLNFTDKMSMSHSLEIRTPFLDYRLVDQAFQIKPTFKTSLFEKKIILKKIAEKYISKDLIYRRKQGFAAPIEIWLHTLGKENTEILIDSTIIGKYIDKQMIEDDLALFFHKGIDRSMQIYAYIVFSKWYKHISRYIHE